jgi:hypothetical protein
MSPLLLLPLQLALATASAHDPATDPSHAPHHGHAIIDRASELVPWCRAEAERRFVAKGLTPYQWSASYHDRGKMLSVSGRLRVEGRDVEVRCSVVRGAREYDASIQIDDDRL